MPLPKIDVATFECKLPSTGQTIKYRPFLVKEEKIIHKTKIIQNFMLSFLLSLLEKYNKVVLDFYFNEERLNSLNTNMLDASTKLSMLYANFKQNKIKYDSVYLNN